MQADQQQLQPGQHPLRRQRRVRRLHQRPRLRSGEQLLPLRDAHPLQGHATPQERGGQGAGDGPLQAVPPPLQEPVPPQAGARASRDQEARAAVPGGAAAAAGQEDGAAGRGGAAVRPLPAGRLAEGGPGPGRQAGGAGRARDHALREPLHGQTRVRDFLPTLRPRLLPLRPVPGARGAPAAREAAGGHDGQAGVLLRERGQQGEAGSDPSECVRSPAVQLPDGGAPHRLLGRTGYECERRQPRSSRAADRADLRADVRRARRHVPAGVPAGDGRISEVPRPRGHGGNLSDEAGVQSEHEETQSQLPDLQPGVRA